MPGRVIEAAISVLDLDRWEVIARLSDVNGRFGMTFSDDGRSPYVAHSGGCGDERLGGISVLRVDLDAGGRCVRSTAALAASLLLVAGGLILLFRRCTVRSSADGRIPSAHPTDLTATP